MSLGSRLALCIATLLLAPAAGGCGTSQSPASHAGQQTTARGQPSPKTTDKDAESLDWVPMSDTATRIAFSLPRKTRSVSRTQPGLDGSTYESRMYQSETNGISVALVVSQSEHGFTGYDPRSVFRGMVEQFTGMGATDARLSGLAPVRHRGMTGYDVTVTFTSLKGDETYWRVRSLVRGDILLSLQVQIFTPTVDDGVRLRVDRAFMHLNRSLRT